MKKKRIIRTDNRSKIAVCLYFVQLAIVAPILLPLIAVSGLTEYILSKWCNYKDWYLAKTRSN